MNTLSRKKLYATFLNENRIKLVSQCAKHTLAKLTGVGQFVVLV